MPVARLRGVVEDKGADWVVVGVGGLGIVASVPSRTADELRAGVKASLFTHLHVREDALTLYGFTSRDELTLFEQLIGVSGVGPRAALGLLSALDAPQLAVAIASGHTELLRKVPGVGQKTGERLVLELRDKVAVPADVPPPSMTKRGQPQADAELVAALMGLGYTQAEAAAAADRLPEDGNASLEERIRSVLQSLAPR
jgi:Holliday junction DNA helicase RuvA